MGQKASNISNDEIRTLKNATHFDRKELQKWYTGFMSGSPSGNMSEMEFVRLYQQFFPIGDPSKFAKFVFKVFDKDADGCVNFQEFVTTLSVTSRGSLDEKLDYAFSLYDLDRDGYVTKGEMLSIVKSIWQIWQMANLSQNAGTPEMRVDMIFATMDRNGDGKVTKEEFRKGFKRDPWIVQALAIDVSKEDVEEEMTERQVSPVLDGEIPEFEELHLRIQDIMGSR